MEKKKKNLRFGFYFVCEMWPTSTRFFGPPSWTSSDLDHCIRKEKYIYLATFNLKRYTYIYILEFWEYIYMYI